MAIRGPKGAQPTTRGWIDPRTGELLKSQRITANQIAEWYGHVAPVHHEPEPAPVIQTLHEAPVVEHVVSQDYHHVDVSEEGQEEETPPADDGFKLW